MERQSWIKRNVYIHTHTHTHKRLYNILFIRHIRTYKFTVNVYAHAYIVLWKSLKIFWLLTGGVFNVAMQYIMCVVRLKCVDWVFFSVTIYSRTHCARLYTYHIHFYLFLYIYIYVYVINNVIIIFILCYIHDTLHNIYVLYLLATIFLMLFISCNTRWVACTNIKLRLVRSQTFRF